VNKNEHSLMFMSPGHDEYTMTFSKIKTYVLILLSLVVCSVMVVNKITNAMENVDKSTSFENDGYEDSNKDPVSFLLATKSKPIQEAPIKYIRLNY